jgi:hypothetical protein
MKFGHAAPAAMFCFPRCAAPVDERAHEAT